MAALWLEPERGFDLYGDVRELGQPALRQHITRDTSPPTREETSTSRDFHRALIIYILIPSCIYIYRTQCVPVSRYLNFLHMFQVNNSLLLKQPMPVTQS
jgi:hypothetical protein